MDREELVQQILKQVLAKLTDMGEKADAACVRPDAVCPAANAIKLSKKISIKRKKSLTRCEKCAAKS